METYSSRNPYIVTHSGRLVHLLNPTVEEIDIEDIAWALSNICRYTGHTSRFYSVAQHCVHVSNYVPHNESLWGLLHDATEAYLGDVNAPLKSLLSDYRVIENRFMNVICDKYGLSREMPANVHYYDACMLHNEVESFMPNVDISTWKVEGIKIPDLNLFAWHRTDAFAIYYQRFYDLIGQK